MNIEEIISEIEDLDTFPPSAIVINFVDKVLNCEVNSEGDNRLILQCLSELVEKLSENYDRVTANQSKEIVDWANLNWFANDLEYLDLILTVLVNVDSRFSKPFLEEKAFCTDNSSSRELIVEALSEI